MASRRLVPLFNRVVVKKLAPVNKTASGVLLPESAATKNHAVVVAAGPGLRTSEGTVVPCSVKAGDKVLLADWGATSVKLDGEELFVLRDEDILGVLDKQ